MAKAKIKTLLGTGLAALCSHIKQCNTAIGDLSEATANGFEETDDTKSRMSRLRCLL